MPSVRQLLAGAAVLAGRAGCSSLGRPRYQSLARTGPPPTTPANLRAVSVDGKVRSIAWDPSSHDGPVWYSIYSGGVQVATTASPSITILELWHIGCIDIGPNYFTVQAWGEHEYGSAVSSYLFVDVQNPNY